MRYLINSSIFVFIILTAVSCSREPSPRAGTTDAAALTIVSLSPSITRQLIGLGAEDMIIGVTDYSPPMKKNAAIIGSLVNPSLEAIVSLKPGIVLLSDEDAAVQKGLMIERSGLRVERFKANTGFRTIAENYLRLGRIVGRAREAEKKILACENFLAKFAPETISASRIVFFVSTTPLIPAAGVSFIGDIITMSGGINIFETVSRPYPVISSEELIKRNPEIIITAIDNPDRGFFAKRFASMEAVKNGRVYFVDTDPFAYYTPDDYVRSVKILAGLLNKK